MTNKKILNLHEPMTSEDCAFLASVYLPCGKDSTVLDLASLTTEEIQDFAIVFKVLDGNNKYIVSLPLLYNPLHSLPPSWSCTHPVYCVCFSQYQQTISTRHGTGKFTYYIQRVYWTADWLREPGEPELTLLTIQTAFFFLFNAVLHV